MSFLPASVTLDLDNQWAYMKTQGVAGWEEFPSYLDLAVPRILNLLHAEDVRMTVFVVGKDAADPANADPLLRIAKEGHEIGNHSFMHEPWLHLYDEERLRADFEKSETAIEAATGHRPRGFRGPGFSTSTDVRNLLRERGYAYDSSLFPTWLGPLARTYFFLSAKLPPEEKERRRKLYGRVADAFSPLKPYEIAPGLVEFPVTTAPLLRTPIHLTYLLFLARFSTALARCYWNSALALCRVAGVAPCLLLHPTDFLDVDDVPAMSFFPAMNVAAGEKALLVRHVLRTLKAHWNLLPLLDACRLFKQQSHSLTPHLAFARQPQDP